MRALCLLGLLFLWTQSLVVAAEPSTLAEQFQTLKKEYDSKVKELQKAFPAARTTEERRKLAEEYKGLQTYAGKMLALAEKNPQDPLAPEVLTWVVEHAQGPERDKAVTRITTNYLASDKIGPACALLTELPEGEKTLRAILSKNPHRSVQGLATFHLASHLKERSDGSEDAAAHKQTAEAEQLFEQVLAKFADVSLSGETLGKLAKPELFELRNLAIGKLAPEISGQDIDGKPLKLSDYRGKVVVLDFWGNW